MVADWGMPHCGARGPVAVRGTARDPMLIQ